MRVLVFAVVLALGCGPRARSAYETQPPRPTQSSSNQPSPATEHLCGHYRVLLTIQRTLDRAEASEYLARCIEVLDQHRQVMSASAFADMTTCASMAASVEAFAQCARTDELRPIVIPQPVTPLTASEQRARDLYVHAEHLAAVGRWAEAVPVYEEAYYIVPGKHGFAHKIGIAAWYAGNCNTAKEYLEHFLRYAEPEKYADKLAEAKQILGEIAMTGCALE